MSPPQFRAEKEFQPDTTADTNAENNLRKRWTYLLPIIFVTYSLAYLDRANFGFGAAAGLASTLHITGQDTSLLAGLFFLGYFMFQVPGAILARKYSVRRVVFATLILWGIFATFTGVIRQFWVLALDRFLLGVAESLVFPVMLHLLTQWFTRAERSRANAILMLGNPVTLLLMSPLTGYLIQKLGWQTTFVAEGIPSILWAVVWIVVIRDRPSDAKWLDPRAAEKLEDQLTREQVDLAPVGVAYKAFLRPDVLLLAGSVFLLEFGRLWIRPLVADDRAQRCGTFDGKDGLAFGTALSGCDRADAHRLAYLRQNPETPFSGLAIINDGRYCPDRLVLPGRAELHSHLCLPGHLRRGHLWAVRSVLRHHSRAATSQCHRRGARIRQ